MMAEVKSRLHFDLIWKRTRVRRAMGTKKRSNSMTSVADIHPMIPTSPFDPKAERLCVVCERKLFTEGPERLLAVEDAAYQGSGSQWCLRCWDLEVTIRRHPELALRILRRVMRLKLEKV